MALVKYVLDTNVFSHLFGSYYPKVFPSLWREFGAMVNGGSITSTSEVLRELGDSKRTADAFAWAQAHSRLFPSPTPDESNLATRIFQYPAFRHLAFSRNRSGRSSADTYIVTRAHVLDATVLTQEKPSRSGAKIPDVCQHFNIPCINLQQFMEAENWIF